MDLNKMVNASLAKIEQENIVKDLVDERIKKTLRDIIEESLGTYSKFGKELKTQIGEQLQINLENLDIPRYNVLIRNAIKLKIDEFVTVNGIEKIKKDLDELFMDTQKEYKLSELINSLKKESREDYDGCQEISFHLNDCSSLAFVDFDPEPGLADYECRYKLVIGRETGVIKTAELGDKKIDEKLIMGGLFGTKKMIFQAYASGAKIIIDKENIDTVYDNEY